MANWPDSPSWSDPKTINSGNQYNAADGVLYTDMNKIISNLLYLKQLEGIIPTGTLSIVSNDTYDVTKYARVAVNVPQTGGGDQPQLNAPTISIAGTTLSIEDPATNGNFTIGWKLYDDGAYVGQFLTAVIQLTDIQFRVGTHKLTVKSFGTNFQDSAASNEVTYQITEKLATPQNVIANGTTVSWDDVENATSYAVLADGSEIGTVEKAPQEYTDCITFTGETGDFTLKATYKDWDGTVEYSTDHETWTEWDGSEISSSGQKLYLRGSGNTTFCTSDGAQFVLSARAACSGNIQTLLEYSNPPMSIPADYCYLQMFWHCANLTAAPELPATTLASGCYMSMFDGCTSLTQAPELPATTLASSCYVYMFSGCTNLTQAPALPATTLTDSCYSAMFDGCTSLTQAPELPATTLVEYCYNGMFKGCTSLTQAPALPATTLANGCYDGMFKGCTSLTKAPELPATTLARNCYMYMFQGCTSLTKAPELPATTLAYGCYEYMFDGCTNLTQAPALPATTLADWCYAGMFRYCTSLKISTSQSSEYRTAWRIPSSGTISSEATSWNGIMLTNTGGTFTDDPSINTTYYGAW